jgi:hypothetical protein
MEDLSDIVDKIAFVVAGSIFHGLGDSNVSIRYCSREPSLSVLIA